MSINRIKKYIDGLSDLDYKNDNFILYFFKHDIDIETMSKVIEKNKISYSYHDKIYFNFKKHKNIFSFSILNKNEELFKLVYETKKTVMDKTALYLPRVQYSDGAILDYFCTKMKIVYYLLDESDDSISCEEF